MAIEQSAALVPASAHTVEVVQGVIVDNSLAQTSGHALQERIDLMALLLEGTPSLDTRRTYQNGWKAFFGDSTRLGQQWESDPLGAVLEFCSWPPKNQRLEALEFQGRMIAQKKSPATIANRSSAVRSLLKTAHSIGLSETDGTGLFPKVKIARYRDTRGISVEKMKRLVKLPAELHEGDDKAIKTLRLRDNAIVRLFCENGIRNKTMRDLKVKDFSLTELYLMIKEKGKGDQQRRITISSNLAQHIEVYLRFAGHKFDDEAALFQSAHRGEPFRGGHISPNGMRWIIRTYVALLEVKRLRPHDLRHSAISLLAKETKGDVIAMQEFSGHADINTLMIYAKQARNRQGDLTNLISKRLEE